MKKIYITLLSLASIFAFMAIIFTFSEQPGNESHSLSKEVSYKMVSTLLNIDGIQSVDDSLLEYIGGLFDHSVRKLAHICIYMIFGVILTTALWLICDFDLKFHHILLATFAVFLVGCCDEAIQYFSGGRGATIKDAFIDTLGGTIGIYVHFMIRDFFKHLSNGLRKFKR